GDVVRLRVREDGRITRGGDLPEGLDPERDLGVRAARLLASEANCTQGADIVIEKRIPAGAGFGGGSSDAATVLLALDALWGTGLGVERLAAPGPRRGAAVPVFVRGGHGWAEGVGEARARVAGAPAWDRRLDPGVHVLTADRFRAPELRGDAPPATISAFASAAVGQRPPLGNAFEPLLRRREPVVEAAFTALARVGTPRL